MLQITFVAMPGVPSLEGYTKVKRVLNVGAPNTWHLNGRQVTEEEVRVARRGWKLPANTRRCMLALHEGHA